METISKCFSTAVCSMMFSAALSGSTYNVETDAAYFNIDMRDSGAVLSLAAGNYGPNFVLPGKNAAKGLWAVEMRPADGDPEKAVRINCSNILPLVYQEQDDVILLRWDKIEIPGQKGTVTVEVSVTPEDDERFTDWRIRVTPESDELGIWQVDFPVIENLTVSETGQFFAPFGPGMVNRDPVINGGGSGMYPHCLCSMQFWGLSDKGGTLYMAAHDPKAFRKSFKVEHTGDREKGLIHTLTHYPEEMGVPGKVYEQPWPFVMGFIEGDWYDAAKLYRSWVLAEAEWMKGLKPIAERTDYPDWFKTLPLWYGLHGLSKENMDLARKLKEEIDVPTAIHIYHWHHNVHDTMYPDFWPPHPPAKEYMAELKNMGYKIMPYINGHLIDEKSESYLSGGDRYIARAAAALGQENEVWAAGPGVILQPLCPATDYWQNKYIPLCRLMVDELGVDGIYIDQVACVGINLCFDPTHGHPVGGGSHWVDGYAKMLNNIRQEFAKDDKFIFLTTESAAEPYNFDGYLRCNEGEPTLRQIWTVVYSGYRNSFGYYFSIPEEYIIKLGFQYIQGYQLGWMALHGKFPEGTVEFMREAAHARYKGSNYLAMGEMLRDPEVSGDIDTYSTFWQNFTTKHSVNIPAVRSTLWRAPDGSLGVAAVNFCKNQQTATFTLTEKTVAPGLYQVNAIYPEDIIEPFTLEVIDGIAPEFTVTLEPESVFLISLTKAE